jgi:hypothetical protein
MCFSSISYRLYTCAVYGTFAELARMGEKSLVVAPDCINLGPLQHSKLGDFQTDSNLLGLLLKELTEFHILKIAQRRTIFFVAPVKELPQVRSRKPHFVRFQVRHQFLFQEKNKFQIIFNGRHQRVFFLLQKRSSSGNKLWKMHQAIDLISIIRLIFQSKEGVLWNPKP